MYVHSYLTMNNNSKLHKSSSIFLAAVLVAGVIAIASPSLAFADEDRKYEKDMKYEKQGWKYNKAECSVSNYNIGEFSEFEASILSSMLTQADTNSAASSDENINSIGEEMDASFAIGSNDVGIESNGGSGLELDIENICINFGDNENFGTVGSVNENSVTAGSVN